ncbi:MAG: TonB-dependent receptor [bacterium]|nr:TonB-dependent receptor [bacterium]
MKTKIAFDGKRHGAGRTAAGFRLRSVLWALVLSAAWMTASAQAGTLSGTVKDASGRPLPGANVFLRGTLLGAVSGSDGNFTVQDVPDGTCTLVVSMMGFRTVVKSGLAVSGAMTDVDVRMDEAPLSGDPVVVTASKHAEALSAAHQSVTVIGAERLAERQTRRLEEAIGAVPGVHFNEENVSIRGSSGYSVFNVGSRVLLLVDGVSTVTSDLGGINWKILPLLDVERIEIVKGAGSALYGSSAMGGVINLITREPSRRLRVRLRALAGVYDDPAWPEWKWTERRLHFERTDMSVSRSFGPVGLQFGVTRHTSTGYMENNEADLWNVSAKAGIRFRGGSRLDLYAARMRNREGGFIQWLSQNRPLEVPPYNKEDAIEYRATDFHAQYHLPLTPRFGLKARASFLQTEMGNQLTAYNPGAFKPGRGPGMEIQADWLPLPEHHVTSGVEYRRDLSGSQYFGDHEGYTLSPYVQDAWSPDGRWTVTAGGRWDRHVLIGEASENRLSPKIGLNFRPREGTALRLTFGGGFRTATVFEKYITADYSGFNVIPNPGLRSEHSWFSDAGISQDIGNAGRLELTMFRSDYWDMIDPVINFLGTIQFQNFVRARVSGIEGAAEFRFWRRRLGLAANAAWQNPRDLKRKEDLAYRPRFNSTVTGKAFLGPLSLEAEYRYADRIRTVQLNPLDPRVPLKLLEFRAGVKAGAWTLQASVRNALNYHYTQIERRMGEIRSASISLMADIE